MSLRLTPIAWFVILTVVAIGLALGLPPDPHAVQQLHTTQVAYRIAIAVLLIPYVLIWYASFYTFGKLREYSAPLKDSKDGAAFHIITAAMGVLAFSLVVPTIISLILGNIALHNTSFKAAAAIIDNYLSLFPGVVAFLLFYNGTHRLVGTVRGKVRRPDIRWHAPWFLLLCVIFSRLTIENQYQQNSYHLSIWLLVVTVIVPYLYGWIVGLLSAYNLHVYASTVKGLLYKRGVRQLSQGIAVTLIGSIVIQFVNITLAQRVSHSLGSVLLVDYALLIVVAVGLVLMALGAKKLKLLEEV